MLNVTVLTFVKVVMHLYSTATDAVAEASTQGSQWQKVVIATPSATSFWQHKA